MVATSYLNSSGATKGIGRAICSDLATRGCSILGTYSSTESAPLFQTFTETIASAYSSVQDQNPQTYTPKLVGIPASISDPGSSIPLILETLRRSFKGRVDIVILNAAVMGLAKMGEGTVTSNFVNMALEGNVKFPILLMEDLLNHEMINKEGRVISISSEGVRAKRPPGG